MKGKVKFAVTALVLAVFVALGLCASEAAANVKCSVTKYETVRGNDGILRVRVTIEVMNVNNDGRVVTGLYEAKFSISAQITSLTSGKTYTLQANPIWNSITGGKNLNLHPGDTKIFYFPVPYNHFIGDGSWRWEGEEKTGNPPLKNFKAWNISMNCVLSQPPGRPRQR